MGKPRNAAKARYWRKVLRRQHASGEGVTAFCQRAGVSTHQFWWWQRTLRERDAGRRSRDRSCRPGDLPVDGQHDVVTSAFVPIRLPVSLNSSIEVVHPQGCVVRVPPLFDTLTLRRLLAALDAPARTSEDT
jgi:transposase